ncbi:MAG: LPXTG cell wall anchor domain-containing protein [Verrucomicrobiota bacterium]
MKLLIATAFFAASAIACHGAIIINAAKVGGNIVFTGNGSIDLAGAVMGGTGTLGDPAAVVPNSDILGFDFAGGGTTNLQFYTATSVGNFGAGGTTTSPTATGDSFLVDANLVGLPVGYISNTPISFTSTFVGTSFVSLGITSPGTFVWTLPGDTVTLNVAAVPEPSTYIAGAGLLGLGALVLYRRRKQAKAAQ